MKIALVSQEYPPETAKGGLGSQTFLKAHGLAELGHQVHVVSRSLTGVPQERIEGGVQVTRVPGFDGRMAVQTEVADWVTYSAAVAAAVAALDARVKFDLVDFPEWAAEGYVHLLNRTAWHRTPTTIQLHGPLAMLAHTIGWPPVDSEFYRTGRMLEETCVRLADAVYSSSACSAAWCAREYGVDRASIPVLHTGVDIGTFAPRDIAKSSRPTVVFAGKLARNKGIFVLLDACCDLVREFPDLQLRLLGRGEAGMTQQLRDRAERRGCPALLDLPGFVDRAELAEHFSLAHVFAAPSAYEGGPGFVYLEAMACGLPVIACEGSGASEVVRHGENGFLVARDDVPAVAGALRSLLTDEARRQAMAASAREFVRAHADSRTCVKKLEAFYEQVRSQSVPIVDNVRPA